jgi:hypothetical protein
MYLWPFAEGVRAGVGSVMMAYNQVGYLETLTGRLQLITAR